MNAAARLVHQNVLTRHLMFTHLLNKRQMIAIFLAMAVLLSAISVIYATHVKRVLYASYQHNLAEENHLHVQFGQLLLERSTLMMQARVQKIAEAKLGMIIPDHHSVVVIK